MAEESRRDWAVSRRTAATEGRPLDRRSLPPGGVRLLSDGHTALVNSLTRFEVWDLESGSEMTSINLSGPCRVLGVWDLLPNDDGIAVGCREGGFVLFGLEGEVLQRFTLPADAAAYLMEENPGLASFGAVRHEDGTWEDRSRRFDPYTTPSSIAIDAKGKRALVAYGQTYALLWDMGSGELVQVLGEERLDDAPRRIYQVALSPDGTLAATRGNKDGISIWQLTRNRKVAELPVAGPDFAQETDRPADMPVEATGRGGAGPMTFVSGPNELVAAEREYLLHLDVVKGELLGRWLGHERRHPIMGAYRNMPRIHDLRLSADGRRALTVGVDSTIRVWEVCSGSQVWVVRPAPCCVDWADLSQDGERVVWAGCPGMRVYEVP